MYYLVGLLYKLSTIGICEVPMISKTLDRSGRLSNITELG